MDFSSIKQKNPLIKDLTDDKIFFIVSPQVPSKEFDEFEKMLSDGGFEYYSAFSYKLGNDNKLEEMHKLKTMYWCVSLRKKKFLRTQDLPKKKHVLMQPDEFKKKYVGIIRARSFGL